MKNFRSVLWGLVILLLGVIIGLNALDIADIDIFFDGWWTLFIIVPCFIDLFKSSDKTGNVIGIIIGVALLLASNDFFEFKLIAKLLLPLILVAIGIRLIIKAFSKTDSKIKEKIKHTYGENKDYHRVHTAVFAGDTVRLNDEVIAGAELTAVFGGIDFDIRNAKIETDIVINTVAIFGGVDVLIPNNVQLIVRSNSIFGGVTKKALGDPLAENTVFVNANCIFGGVDIK